MGKPFLLLLLAALLLPAAVILGGSAAAEAITVEPISSLPEDFIFGVDISSMLAEEASGVVYRNAGGEAQDLLQTLAEHGVTHVRVRVWNHPYDALGRGYGGGNCDTAKAAEIGRRAAQYGLKLIVDFHYSDFWADPGKQMVPLAWAGLSLGDKADALYAFTGESIQEILSAGGEIAMVQLGNETNGSLCGESDWDAIVTLMAAGGRAVRERCPEALVAVHFTNPERSGSYVFYAGELAARGLDYDVFASSYYPYWHGTLDNLREVLGDVAERYGKKVMVIETSYAYTDADTDFFGNTVNADSALPCPYPHSVQGQADEIRDVAAAVASVPGGLGVCYWEGAWISVGQSSWAENNRLWEQYGSGWASSYAGSYDPEDAGKWHGGCAVDNQALFAPDGTPLASLRVFSRLRQK